MSAALSPSAPALSALWESCFQLGRRTACGSFVERELSTPDLKGRRFDALCDEINEHFPRWCAWDPGAQDGPIFAKAKAGFRCGFIEAAEEWNARVEEENARLVWNPWGLPDSGFRDLDDDGAIMAWAVVPLRSDMSTDEQRRIQAIHDAGGWAEFYGGPGRAFGHAVRVRIGRTHALVTQYRALDI